MVQIFEMSDDDAQRIVGGILSGVDGITVELAFRGPDRFLVVTCRNSAQALGVQRFVTAVDPRAVALQTSPRAPEPVELTDAVSEAISA